VACEGQRTPLRWMVACATGAPLPAPRKPLRSTTCGLGSYGVHSFGKQAPLMADKAQMDTFYKESLRFGCLEVPPRSSCAVCAARPSTLMWEAPHANAGVQALQPVPARA
jgi:hypothetical protein